MSFSRNLKPNRRRPYGGSKCRCDKCSGGHCPPKPKPVCVTNCDDDKPLKIKVEEPLCVGVQNCDDAPLRVKVFNTTECPIHAEVNAWAEIEGCITVNTCPSDPLMIAGVITVDGDITVDGTIKVENGDSPFEVTNGSEPFCVALQNKEGEDPLKIKIGWNQECDDPIPVYGRFEICNCCSEPLLMESSQFETSQEIGGVSAGTSLADLLAMLLGKLP